MAGHGFRASYGDYASAYRYGSGATRAMATLVVAFERLMLGTSHVAGWLRDRLFGSFDAAFTARETMAEVLERLQQPGADAASAIGRGSDYTPDVARFVSNPDVWIGLVVAAALITAAVWLRRRQESQST